MPESLNLSNLKPAQERQDRKRVGRGLGSGKGRYSGRGIKGQKSRAGSHAMRAGFEGGQMPLTRRLPKRGFTNPFRTESQVIRLDDLDQLAGGDEVTKETLVAAGAVKANKGPVKVLANGEITKAVTVRGLKVSAGAREKIVAAGGRVEE